MKEIWKYIPGYEGYYQISEEGTVKRLERYRNSNGGSKVLIKEMILKPYLSTNKKYLNIKLQIDLKSKSYGIHQLIAMTFLNHKPCGHKLVVDHIDENTLNNSKSNLRILTQRENLSRRKNTSSKYTGVYFSKAANKWESSISIDGKRIYIGLFKSEIKAHQEYQKALKEYI